MADTSESDGIENRVPDHDSNASSRIADADLSKRTFELESDVTIATSVSKRIKMDGDGDGAPSSSEASPRHQIGTDEPKKEVGDGSKSSASAISFDSSAESTPRRTAGKSRSTPSTPQTSVRGQDLSMIDMKTSWDGSASGGSTKGETTDGETGYKSLPFKHRAGMLADPVKIAKEREKEERVRQARERLKEERMKKLEELKEQQRIAQENREKQLEMRRRKIEDLRRRDSERRAAVEERRKMKEEIERARRESILQKAEERVARYEAWKAGGRKGGRGHVLGFGSATPRDICQPFERPRRSSSHSALQRRSPNGSDMDSVRPQRRALSACSAVRRHCCVDFNRIGTSTPAASMAYHHYQRPTNAPGVGNPLTRASLTASMPSPVRMRENKPSRKQRPASVASSMPSFVGGEPAKSPRSKSTDRTGRDRSKTRPPRKDEKAAKDKENQSEKDQKPEKPEDKDGDKEDGGEKKERKAKVSLSFFDRLATPKYSKKDGDATPRDTQPKKDAPIIRVQFAEDGDQDGMVEPERTSMREKPPPSAAKDTTPKHAPAKDSHRSTAHTTGPAVPTTPGRSISPGRKGVEKTAGRTASPSRKGGDKSGSSTPRVTPPPSSTSTPTHGPTVPTPSATPASTGATPSTAPGTPAASADDGTTTPRAAAAGSTQDITAEEYKARLAEKRRQAREKAEREAEEERKRQEEERLAELERQRQEEEEQRRYEEETNRLAEEARKAEEERLQKAIEAEEKRKKEEAERMEQERKAKEEADRKAKEEAERLEKEKQEKAKKEEEERLERKKKLEMIMKRVKPDSSAEKTESLTKVVSSSPNLSQQNSSQNSPEEHEKPVTPQTDSDGEGALPAPTEGSAVEPISSAMTMSFHQDLMEQDTSEASSASSSSTVIRSMSSGDILDGPTSEDQGERGSTERLSSSAATTPSKVEEKTPSSEPSSEVKSKFKSPLLQQLVENKGSDSSTGGPKFKSPLLQNLLGKTKVGARMGLSVSMGDLSHKDSAASSSHADSEANASMTASVSSAANNGSIKEIFKQARDDEDKDEDTSIHHSASSPGFGGSPKSFEIRHTVTNGIGRDLGDAGDSSFPSSTSKSSLDSSPPDATRLPSSMMSDSALGSSIEPHGDGELSAPGMMSQSIIFNGHGDHKSHSMEDSSISLHSVTESVTNTASVIPFETVVESERQEDGAPPTQGDGQFEELIDLKDTAGKNNSIVGGTPIIAFEENNRRSDVTESLS